MFNRDPKNSDETDWRLVTLVILSAAAIFMAGVDMPSLSAIEISLIHLFASLLSAIIIFAVLVFHWDSMVKFTRLTTFWRVLLILVLIVSNVLIAYGAFVDSPRASIATVLSVFASFYAIWSMLFELLLERFFPLNPREKQKKEPANRNLKSYAIRFWILFSSIMGLNATIGDEGFVKSHFSPSFVDIFSIINMILSFIICLLIIRISSIYLNKMMISTKNKTICFILSLVGSITFNIFLNYISKTPPYSNRLSFTIEMTILTLCGFIGLFSWSFGDFFQPKGSPQAQTPAKRDAYEPSTAPALSRHRSETVSSNLAFAAENVQPKEAIATSETLGASPMRRRGWQLPDPQSVSDTSPPRQEEHTIPRTPPALTGQQIPAQTMAGSIAGQVTDVEQATLQSGQTNVPILTLRLERNDPHAGRTFVASVRLVGTSVSGFADVGDWVEAIGRKSPTFLAATRCVNHTTQAVYIGGLTSRWPWARQGLFKVVTTIVGVAIMLLVFSQLSSQFNQAGRQMLSNFQQASQQMQSDFEKSSPQPYTSIYLPL